MTKYIKQLGQDDKFFRKLMTEATKPRIVNGKVQGRFVMNYDVPKPAGYTGI